MGQRLKKCARRGTKNKGYNSLQNEQERLHERALNKMDELRKKSSEERRKKLQSLKSDDSGLESQEFSRALGEEPAGIELSKADSELESESSDLDDNVPFPSPTSIKLHPVEAGQEEHPLDEMEDDYTCENDNPHYNIAVIKIGSYLRDNPEAELGQGFWYRLNVDERIAVFQKRQYFVDAFRDRASIKSDGSPFLTPEWIANKYTKALYVGGDYRARRRLAEKIKKQMERKSSTMVKKHKITKAFYRLHPTKQSYITTDLNIMTYYDRELVPLESFPSESLGHLEGFQNLTDVERHVLFQAIYDKRDGTNKAKEFVTEEGVDINVDDLYDTFWRSGHVHSYKPRKGIVLGARALVDDE